MNLVIPRYTIRIPSRTQVVVRSLQLGQMSTEEITMAKPR